MALTGVNRQEVIRSVFGNGNGAERRRPCGVISLSSGGPVRMPHLQPALTRVMPALRPFAAFHRDRRQQLCPSIGSSFRSSPPRLHPRHHSSSHISRKVPRSAQTIRSLGCWGGEESARVPGTYRPGNGHMRGGGWILGSRDPGRRSRAAHACSTWRVPPWLRLFSWCVCLSYWCCCRAAIGRSRMQHFLVCRPRKAGAGRGRLIMGRGLRTDRASRTRTSVPALRHLVGDRGLQAQRLACVGIAKWPEGAPSSEDIAGSVQATVPSHCWAATSAQPGYLRRTVFNG